MHGNKSGFIISEINPCHIFYPSDRLLSQFIFLGVKLSDLMTHHVFQTDSALVSFHSRINMVGQGYIKRIPDLQTGFSGRCHNFSGNFQIFFRNFSYHFLQPVIIFPAFQTVYFFHKGFIKFLSLFLFKSDSCPGNNNFLPMRIRRYHCICIQNSENFHLLLPPR